MHQCDMKYLERKTSGGVLCDLYCSPPSDGDQCVLAFLWESTPFVRFYTVNDRDLDTWLSGGGCLCCSVDCQWQILRTVGCTRRSSGIGLMAFYGMSDCIRIFGIQRQTPLSSASLLVFLFVVWQSALSCWGERYQQLDLLPWGGLPFLKQCLSGFYRSNNIFMNARM